MSSLAVERQEPRLSLLPAWVSNDADDARFLSSAYGLAPDPWQQLVLEAWLGRRGDGKWSALTCGLSIPRQNGKNALIEMRCLFGLVGLGEKFLHTAHEVKTARKAWKRLKFFFGNQVSDPAAMFPELNALVSEMRSVNGQEALYLRNGGSVEMVARSKNSGRGFTVDTLIIDEAQELTDDEIEALLPTTSASPAGNPQWIFTGTPPGPRAAGEVFGRIRESGVSGKGNRLSWQEWSAERREDDSHMDDRAVWAAVNPALVTGRLQIEVCESERAEVFSDEGFARERLGMWSGATSQRVIPASTWADLADVDSRPTDHVAYGIDVSPDSSRASIGLAAWREDGRRHVEFGEGHAVGDEVTGHKVLGTSTVQSVGWVVAVAAKLAEKRRAVFVVEANSPAAALVDPLKRAGVDVLAITTRDYANACVRFNNEAHEGLLAHLDQPSLNFALSVARKKAYGTEGQWLWHRRSSDSDITPLSAVTLAMHGLSARKPRSNSASFF